MPRHQDLELSTSCFVA